MAIGILRRGEEAQGVSGRYVERQKVSQKAQASDGSSVYQAAGDLYLVTGARPAPQALAALPPAAATLVGREAQAAEVLALLDPRGTGPAATLVTGPAGVGKTALALHSAHAAIGLGWFPGGVLFAPLHGYDGQGEASVEQVLAALLRALGVPGEDVPAGGAERLGLFRSELGRRGAGQGPVLLLADDAGHVGQVEALVPAHLGHRLLVTSRRTLAALPARLVSLGELDAAAGAELIAGGLLLARPGDLRPAAEPEALAELVAFCGRLPLALRVIAALLVSDPGLPLATLVADLADARGRLSQLVHDESGGEDDDELREGGSTRAGRGGLAVRAAFELSYRRLDSGPARLFRLFTVNPGSDLSTVSAAALTGTTPRTARRFLAALAAHSLLAEQPVGADRWRMHDLIRLYGTELSEADPQERRAALGRLLDHYLTTAAAGRRSVSNSRSSKAPAAGVRQRFQGWADAMAWLDAERENLVASVPLALSAGLFSVAGGLGGSVTEYLRERHYAEEALDVARMALEAARRTANRKDEASATNNLAVSLAGAGHLEEAVRTYRQALELREEVGDHAGRLVTLNNLGVQLLNLGRTDEAITALTEAMELSSGDPGAEGRAHSNLGRALAAAGRTDDAIDAYDQAIALYRASGHRRGEAETLDHLGRLCRHNRWFDQAIALHTRSLEIWREIDDPVGEAYAWHNLALALSVTERYEEAIEAHTRDMEMCQEQRHRRGQAVALNGLAHVLVAAGRHLEALDRAEAAIALSKDLGDRQLEGVALSNLGAALLWTGRPNEAIAAHEEDLRIATEEDDRASQASAWNQLGRAYRVLHRHAEAIRAYRLAFTLFGEAEDFRSTATAMLGLGMALTEAGRPEDAIEFYEAAANLFTALGETDAAAKAETYRAAAASAGSKPTESTDVD
ncbi:tetratricopeptide repeat protein [Streptomyces sp. NPDC013012]|uniref:tetratricopeptide repeat protein n=1 Tax=Streptomyces sp. NPDC013012 TaxID=3364860 RepID=UPI0036B9923D